MSDVIMPIIGAAILYLLVFYFIIRTAVKLGTFDAIEMLIQKKIREAVKDGALEAMKEFDQLKPVRRKEMVRETGKRYCANCGEKRESILQETCSSCGYEFKDLPRQQIE